MSIGFTGDADFDTLLDRCNKLLKVKGHDYTAGSPDRLANFRSASGILGQTQETVLGVYLWKHLSAIFTYLQKGQLESEPIEERIVDSINYLLLLGKMVAEKKQACASTPISMPAFTPNPVPLGRSFPNTPVRDD